MVACWACDQTGCSNCRDGYVIINGCPREFVGSEMISAINVASLCTDGILPASGGLMDQSAWFVDLWTNLRNNEEQIKQEQAERRHGARS